MWLSELLNLFYCPNITIGALILTHFSNEIIMMIFGLQNHKVKINFNIDFSTIYYNLCYKYNLLHKKSC